MLLASDAPAQTAAPQFPADRRHDTRRSWRMSTRNMHADQRCEADRQLPGAMVAGRQVGEHHQRCRPAARGGTTIRARPRTRADEVRKRHEADEADAAGRGDCDLVNEAVTYTPTRE